MKTEAAVRIVFWNTHPNLDKRKIKMGKEYIYKTDTRCAFVDFVDQLQRSGQISERLAQRVTL